MTAIGKYLALGACLLASACASVAPWERGNLAKPEMAFVRNPGQTEYQNHVHDSREASAAGNVGSGGGCGCI